MKQRTPAKWLCLLLVAAVLSGCSSPRISGEEVSVVETAGAENEVFGSIVQKSEEGREETMINHSAVQGTGGVPGGLAMPGGSHTVQDPEASKNIQSQDMVSFEVSTGFESLASAKKYSYVYGYASKVDDGVLVSYICKAGNGLSQSEPASGVALVEDGIFPELQKIVSEYNFAKSNGYFHSVSGLPGNLGGSAEIRYSSGEYISFSDNQSPVMAPDAGAKIVDLIKKYCSEKRMKTLDTGDIVSVRYREDREDGYADYLLEGNQLISENKFGEGENQFFRNEKEVPENSMDKIREMAYTGLLLHWKGIREIPDPVFPNRKQQVIFKLKNGNEISINGNMKGPGPAGNSVFNIQMYLQYTLGQ